VGGAVEFSEESSLGDARTRRLRMRDEFAPAQHDLQVTPNHESGRTPLQQREPPHGTRVPESARKAPIEEFRRERAQRLSACAPTFFVASFDASVRPTILFFRLWDETAPAFSREVVRQSTSVRSIEPLPPLPARSSSCRR